MRAFWLLLCLLFPFVTLAQNGIITGKITRTDTKAPIGQANVFLSNTTAGTSSADDGTYTLAHLKPGQYTLVVSIIGYESYTKNVLVGSEPIKLDIQLGAKTIELRDVIITTPANWKKNYEQFRREFIGTTENSKLCRVVNPHILNLIYHRNKQQLEASGDEFLVVLEETPSGRNVTITERPVGKTRFEKLEIDAADITAQPALIERLGRMADPDLVLDVRIGGVRPDELDLHPDEIESALAPSFLKVRIRDLSLPALTEGALPSPDTIAGAFIRDLEARIAELEAVPPGEGAGDPAAEAAELRDALRLGRLLLAGHEVSL